MRGKVSSRSIRAAIAELEPHERAVVEGVYFHSFRRAFNTGLAEANVNVQHAMHLAAHSDPKVHGRYVMSTLAMRTTPTAALVSKAAAALRIVTARDDSSDAAHDRAKYPRRGRDSNPRMTVLQLSSWVFGEVRRSATQAESWRFAASRFRRRSGTFAPAGHYTQGYTQT